MSGQSKFGKRSQRDCRTQRQPKKDARDKEVQGK